jgi:hypothetical protein
MGRKFVILATSKLTSGTDSIPSVTLFSKFAVYPLLLSLAKRHKTLAITNHTIRLRLEYMSVD